MEVSMAGRLIAYYSRDGENYCDGRIVDLAEGNTQVIAKKIQHFTGGDLFRIEPLHPYPAGYDEAVELAQQELKKHVRPELAGSPCPAERYDIVYLGYPIWWGVMPMPVLTFLEQYDFSGKTVIPFCTHEGSGMGDSVAYIRRSCPGARVLEGLALYGSRRDRSDQAIRAWLDKTEAALKVSGA